MVSFKCDTNWQSQFANALRLSLGRIGESINAVSGYWPLSAFKSTAAAISINLRPFNLCGAIQKQQSRSSWCMT